MNSQTASRPRTIAFSGQSAGGTHSSSGAASANQADLSRRLKASIAPRTSSTFSCDIAYSDSPAASRASARSGNVRMATIL